MYTLTSIGEVLLYAIVLSGCVFSIYRKFTKKPYPSHMKVVAEKNPAPPQPTRHERKVLLHQVENELKQLPESQEDPAIKMRRLTVLLTNRAKLSHELSQPLGVLRRM
jgi:hypothetical protein